MNLDKVTQHFPSGIAMGKAFINREKEREALKKNILANRHIILMAPRRYGKTSLISKVASETSVAFGMIDLLAVYSDESVRDALYDKIGKILVDMLPPAQQAKEKLLSILSSLKPELTLSAFGQKLVFHSPENTGSTITNLLLKLDETASHFKKKVVLFIDEMQQISFLKNAHSIEASIRHAVERSQNVTYCFSGSSRHLLKKMFGDKERPLYRLCHTLEIGRIEGSHYMTYLNQCAKSKWGRILDVAVFEKILMLTKRHPFYVNALCQCIWMEDAFPSPSLVQQYWEDFIKNNRHIITDDIIGLSLNQKRLLTLLAKTPSKELYSADFLSRIKLTPSSVRKAIDLLLEKDLIYVDDNDLYRILDPAIEDYIIGLN